MRRATAVKRLQRIAERCERVCGLWEEGTGLVAVYAFGSVLDPNDAQDDWVDVVQLALVLNEDPAEVTWCARPPEYAGLPYVLELEKAPVDWYFRPASRMLGNHRIQRPLRIWSRETGVEQVALDALAAGRADPLREPALRPAVLRRQLAEELTDCAQHLQRVRDRYWDHRWRREHHAGGIGPENYLWDAVHGYLDLLDAVPPGPGVSADATTRPGSEQPTQP